MNERNADDDWELCVSDRSKLRNPTALYLPQSLRSHIGHVQTKLPTWLQPTLSRSTLSHLLVPNANNRITLFSYLLPNFCPFYVALTAFYFFSSLSSLIHYPPSSANGQKLFLSCVANFNSHLFQNLLASFYKFLFHLIY